MSIISVTSEEYEAYLAKARRSDRSPIRVFDLDDMMYDEIDKTDLRRLPRRISMDSIRKILEYDQSVLLILAYLYINSSEHGRKLSDMLAWFKTMRTISDRQILLNKDYEIQGLVISMTKRHQKLPGFPYNQCFDFVLSSYFDNRVGAINLRHFYYHLLMNKEIYQGIVEGRAEGLILREIYKDGGLNERNDEFSGRYSGAFTQIEHSFPSGLAYVPDNLFPENPDETYDEFLNTLDHSYVSFLDFFPTVYKDKRAASRAASSSSNSMDLHDRVENTSSHHHPMCMHVLRDIRNRPLQDIFYTMCPYVITNNNSIEKMKEALFNRKKFSKKTIDFGSSIDDMRQLFNMNPRAIYFGIENDDGSGFTRQFLTTLSMQFVERFFKKLPNTNGVHIFRRGMSLDDYRFMGAILLFLVRNGHGIPVRLALIDVAGLIYKPIKKGGMEDVKKTEMSYYDVLLFYMIEFGLSREMLRMVNEPDVDVKSVVEDNIIEIYEYDVKDGMRSMYTNILKGLRINDRDFFNKKKISISDMAAIFSVVESTKKSVKSLLIPQIAYFGDDDVCIDGTKEMLDGILSMSNKTYKRLLKEWTKIKEDDAKGVLAARLSLYDDFVRALLEFWSGTDHIILSSVSEYSVRVNDNRGMLPVAHTCGLVLELSKEYSGMDELFFKFLDAILQMYSSQDKFQFL